MTHGFCGFACTVAIILLSAPCLGADPEGDPPVQALELEQMWRIDHPGYGAFGGVAVDTASGDVYVAHDWRGNNVEGTWRTRISWFDSGGNRLAQWQLGPLEGGGAGILRVANLTGDGKPALLMASGVWSSAAFAVDGDGKVLWRYADERGMNDVCAADLTGDGRDEIVMGFNGSGGLHLLAAQGERMWKSTGPPGQRGWRLTNVWSVAAGPIGPDGEVHIVAPCSAACVCIVDSAGEIVRRLEPQLRDPKQRGGLFFRGPAFRGVRHVRLGYTGEDEPPIIVVSSGDGLILAGLDVEGNVLWRTVFEDNRDARTFEPAAAPDQPWVAIPMWDQRVHIHDVRTGERLTTVEADPWANLAWIPAREGESPMLIVGSRPSVTAYRVRDVRRGPDDAEPR